MSQENKYNFKIYENIFYFSIENPIEGKGEIENDLMLEGDLARLSAGLAQQIVRHPEVGYILSGALLMVEDMSEEDKNLILNI